MLDNKVTLVEILNPFDPAEQRRTPVVIENGNTVGSVIPPLMNSYVVSLNGKIIEHENISTQLIKPGDFVVVCPVPQGGGGGGKNILRMVAMIAVAIYAPYLAVGLGGAAAGTVGALTTFGTVLSAGITMVGGMLINALLPPSTAKPSSNNFNQSFEESRSYGIDGAKNTSDEDVVTPVVYGKFRIGGNRIATHVENMGNTQQLNMLFNAGEGPIAGISDVMLNGQPIENFESYHTSTRIGTATQEPIGTFQETVIPKSRGVLLSPTFTEYTTTQEVDRLRFDFVAQNGIAFYNAKGGVDRRTVGLQIQYRLVGEQTWKNLENSASIVSRKTVYNYSDTDEQLDSLRSGTNVNGSAIVDSSTGVTVGTVGTAPVYSTSHSISGAGRQPVRLSIKSPIMPQGKYETRVRRTSSESTASDLIDGVAWSDVNEIISDPVAYRHTALLAVSIKLSDQLSSMPNVTYLHHGKLIRVRRINDDGSYSWFYEPNANPAWVAYDILTHKRYGGGVNELRFLLNQWQEWADYCDEFGLEFNGVFDTQSNVWDALTHVFRAGHAQIVNRGTRYSVAIERADKPVMMFNSSNVIEKSFKLSWLPRSDRANEIEITFWNRDDDFKRGIIKVRDPDLLPTDKVRTAKMTLYGITDPEQIYKEAVFHLNLNKHILQTVTFDAPIEAIGCTIGSQILVQHEITNWGDGGRLEEGCTGATMRLDREVDLLEGRNYRLLVIFDHLLRASGTVNGVVANIVWLNGYDGRTDIKRAIINGVDMEVLRVVNDGNGTYGIEVRSTNAIITGQSYSLYDTDVIEERNVSTEPGAHTELVVDASFPQAPSKYTKWMFGEIGKEIKKFRITSIAGSQEYTRTISGLEYSDEVYNVDNGEVIPVVEQTVSISQVRNLFISNSWVKSGVTYSPVADLGWQIPTQGYYGGALIYMAINGGDFIKVGDAGSAETTFRYAGLSVGDEVAFKVVAKDIVGQLATMSTAPVVTHTMQARPETGTPTNLTVKSNTGSYVLTWTNPTESFSGIEIWRSTIDDVATASKINEVTGISYTDSSAPVGVRVYFWVRTVNADGLFGEWNAANGASAPVPGAVSNLKLSSPFVGTEVNIEWTGLESAKDYLVEVSANGTLSRTLPTVETRFKYTIADAIADNNVGRSITFKVKPRLYDNTVGVESVIVATNPQIPTAPANVQLGTTGDHVSVSFDRKTDSDIAGYKIWASTEQGFTPNDATLVRNGSANGTIFPVESGADWYVVTAAYDVWGDENLVMSGELSVYAASSADVASQLIGKIDRSHLNAVLGGELDALGNEWTVKVQQTAGGTPYIAGMGLSVVEGESGEVTGQMIIRADDFAILPSAAIDNPISPFLVSGGDVYINSLFVEDGSITNAKIGNVIQSNTYNATEGWRIDKNGTAEFSNIIIRDSAGNIILSSGGGVVGGGGPVDAGDVDGLGAMALIDQITDVNVSTFIASAAIGEAHIAEASITEAKVANGAITNAKIGDYIQSNNYDVENKTGWRLQKDGNFTIYGSGGAGNGYTIINNDNMRVFDENGVLRVKLGYIA